MGISNYDISSTLATSVSQRLLRKVCPHCAVQRDFTKEEIEIMKSIGEKYGTKFDFAGKNTYNAVGCEKCNHTGYYDRVAAYEILILDDDIKELIVNNASSIEIRNKALEGRYKPLVIDGINKIINGTTTLEELNNKLSLY